MNASRSIAAALLLNALAPGAARAQQFRFPVECADCIRGMGHFDNDKDGGKVDFNCGGDTYDGHRGTDLGLRGGNGAIDEGHDIVAAAGGTVVEAIDGFFDRCTACGPADAGCGPSYAGGFANHVTVNSSGYRVLYAHMRKGSVAVKVGDTVTCGQKLGEIGSSGCSSGAHTHFEVKPLGGKAIDPFTGPCSPTAPPGLWVLQNPKPQLPGTVCASTSPVDADGDGATSTSDCNDADASIHLGATEVCGDGIDQDCDGVDRGCGASADAGVEPGAENPEEGASPSPSPEASPTPRQGGRLGCSAGGTTALFGTLLVAFGVRRRLSGR